MIENYLLDLIGRSEENAISKICNDYFVYRIIKKDKTVFAITDDFNCERINLEIKKGIITEAFSG